MPENGNTINLETASSAFTQWDNLASEVTPPTEVESETSAPTPAETPETTPAESTVESTFQSEVYQDNASGNLTTEIDATTAISNPDNPEGLQSLDAEAAAALEGMQQAEMREAADIAATENTETGNALPDNIISPEDNMRPGEVPSTPQEQINQAISQYSSPELRNTPEKARHADIVIDILDEAYYMIDSNETINSAIDALNQLEQKYHQMSDRSRTRGDRERTNRYEELAWIAKNWQLDPRFTPAPAETPEATKTESPNATPAEKAPALNPSFDYSTGQPSETPNAQANADTNSLSGNAIS